MKIYEPRKLYRRYFIARQLMKGFNNITPIILVENDDIATRR